MRGRHDLLARGHALTESRPRRSELVIEASTSKANDDIKTAAYSSCKS